MTLDFNKQRSTLMVAPDDENYGLKTAAYWLMTKSFQPVQEAYRYDELILNGIALQ